MRAGIGEPDGAFADGPGSAKGGDVGLGGFGSVVSGFRAERQTFVQLLAFFGGFGQSDRAGFQRVDQGLVADLGALTEGLLAGLVDAAVGFGHKEGDVGQVDFFLADHGFAGVLEGGSPDRAAGAAAVLFDDLGAAHQELTDVTLLAGSPVGFQLFESFGDAHAEVSVAHLVGFAERHFVFDDDVSHLFHDFHESGGVDGLADLRLAFYFVDGVLFFGGFVGFLRLLFGGSGGAGRDVEGFGDGVHRFDRGFGLFTHSGAPGQSGGVDGIVDVFFHFVR